MRRAIAVTALLLAWSARAGVTERVTCAAAKDESYALFVPAGYDAAKRWPIVYALDARGRALAGLEPFRAAAEEYGFIIASSYNSASDGTNEPNVAALSAMWRDTHASLSIDDRRIYVAGFSGTVRAAVVLALASPGAIDAILGSGAGFPPDVPPAPSMKFGFFGAVGSRDFNFSEMEELEHSLSAAHMSHRIVTFDGRHEWMPASVAREALQWLVLREMRRGVRPVDAALVESLWADDSRRLENAWIVDLQRRWTAIASDYERLRDVALAVTAATDIAKSKEFRRAHARFDRELRDERAAMENGVQIIASSRTAASAIRDLRVDPLKSRTDDSAKRILSLLLAQASFYLPRQDPGRAEYYREVANALR